MRQAKYQAIRIVTKGVPSYSLLYSFGVRPVSFVLGGAVRSSSVIESQPIQRACSSLSATEDPPPMTSWLLTVPARPLAPRATEDCLVE